MHFSGRSCRDVVAERCQGLGQQMFSGALHSASAMEMYLGDALHALDVSVGALQPACQMPRDGLLNVLLGARRMRHELVVWMGKQSL